MQCNGCHRRNPVIRCPFPNHPVPQETLDIVTRASVPVPSKLMNFWLAITTSRSRSHRSYALDQNTFDNSILGRLAGRQEARCLKLFDERFFPHFGFDEFDEDIFPTYRLNNLSFADDMMRREEGVYEDLKYLQGALMPHCYGFHIVSLNEQVLLVVVY